MAACDIERPDLAIRSVPEQGQLVAVRQRHYVVNDVARSVLPERPIGIAAALPALSAGSAGAACAAAPAAHNGPQHLVSLTSIEDDALGEELQVIWELEPAARVIEKVALPQPTGLDDPARLDAFLDAVRWGAASSADVRAIQSPFRSGIDIEDYQLDPVVRAVQMPRVSLLIADDVGLGKTIEAGMVILELIIRHRARRVLVLCPASLQVQWYEQMRDKFGLEFRIVDSDLMKQLRRKRGIHVNPWTHFPRLITSIDFIKREQPLRLMRETLPSEGEPLYPRRYDVLVVDECHNCAPSGRGKYATDSLRTHALRALTPHAEHKLFLTATPHNGYEESFSALLELLDNQRFARGTPPSTQQRDAVMVRRLKSELPPRFDGTPRFPARHIDALEVHYSPEEHAVHAALKRYAQLRQQNLPESDGAERVATEFVLKTLKKRLFSSPAAFAMTIEKHEHTVRAGRSRAAPRPDRGILQRQIDRAEEDYADDVEQEEATGDAVEASTRLFREPTAEERDLLAHMKQWASASAALPDSKAKVLLQWLRDHLRPGGRWSGERVIIFTEYRATQNWLHTILATEGFTAGDRLMKLHGGMDSDDRERVKAAFQAAPAVSPVRILLATDSASEGLDLQNHCSKLIHCEIPWNPNRMEQRNGRIDRHGQRADRVEIFHFVGEAYRQGPAAATSGAGDLDADLEFLMVAARKINAIREDLGNVGPVIARQVEEAMLGRRTRLDTAAAEQRADPVRRMLKTERDIARRIQRLREDLDRSQRELRVSPDNVRKVVEVGLALAGQQPLAPAALNGVWPDSRRPACPVFRMPPLRGTWARCADGINHPHTGEPRPITFDHHIASGRDDVVLAHLNHRLVQMSLRLLRAEVWSVEGRRQLHRMTARLVPDHILRDPALIAHARLVVVGGDSRRLHEELIAAGGVLSEGRFARLNVGQVEEALGAALDREPAETMKRRLLELFPQHEPSLTRALEVRVNDRTQGLHKALAEREAKEISDITAILTELGRTIEDKLGAPDLQQQLLGDWTDEERHQLERNMGALRARVREIPGETVHETEAIRARFADPQPRMFPVAVTFLVPERLAKG